VQENEADMKVLEYLGSYLEGEIKVHGFDKGAHTKTVDIRDH
jgi:hypothetical protein